MKHTSKLIEFIKKSPTAYQTVDNVARALIAEGYTDANGELTFESLLYGSYLYQEFCPPKGYELDDTVYPFSITEHGVTITQERSNLRRPGTLEVKKQDQNGRALAGATFLLEYSTDNGARWAAVFSRDGDNIQAGGCTSSGLSDGQLTTGSSGNVTFSGLRAAPSASTSIYSNAFFKTEKGTCGASSFPVS